MRSYPIYYLALVAVGLILFFGAIFGLGQTSHTNPATPHSISPLIGILPLVALALSALSIGFWIFGLIHLLTNKSIEGTDRIVWLLLVILLNALGSVLYFFLAPNPRITAHAIQNKNVEQGS